VHSTLVIDENNQHLKLTLQASAYLLTQQAYLSPFFGMQQIPSIKTTDSTVLHVNMEQCGNWDAALRCA
jgi:hypothetical protein